MDEIITVIQCVLVLGLFMAGGFISVKTGYISKDAASSVSKIVTRLMFPAWLCSKLLSENITKQQIIAQLPLFVAGALITLALLGAGVLLAVITKAEDKRKYVLFALCSAPNAIFLGLPICQGLFGDEGSLSCTILALGSDLVSWTLTVSLLAFGGEKLSGGKKKKGVHINPVTVVFVVSFILKMVGFNLPEFIQAPLYKFGSALSYLAMVYLGMMLVGADMKGVFKDKMTYLFVPIKCFLIPLCLGVLAAVTGIFSFVQVCVITVVFAASPMISMTVFYKEYGLDYVFGNAVTFICVVLNIVTVPAVYWGVSTLVRYMGLS
ncbi:MAG: AEC family transporter [Clostridia bacterium]|nr:AEC family transporter [Clostridia bacterium]